MVITATVGAAAIHRKDGLPSTVELPTITTITAKGGGRGWNRHQYGGAGYSGGGSWEKTSSSGRGGSNGGRGGGARGGEGTGENIANYHFKHFQLSPGKGGDVHYESPNGGEYFGGGGGGVLVNGNGPTASQEHSQGYGGGSGYEGTPKHALSGVILFEVV